jgi:hypothetical protein
MTGDAGQLPAQVALLRGLTLLAEVAAPPDLALLPPELRAGLPQRRALPSEASPPWRAGMSLVGQGNLQIYLGRSAGNVGG